MATTRFHSFVPAADKAQAVAFMAAMGATGGFSVGLSGDGQIPATWWGESGVWGEDIAAAIKAGTVTVDGVTYTLPASCQWWQVVHARLISNQTFLDSNHAGTAAIPGQPWTWGQGAAELGAQRIGP